MPLTRFASDAFGVVTICLVALLILLGFLCMVYLIYFRSRIRSQGFGQLNYFGSPWIVRVIFILFALWWGFGEVLRLSFLRHEGRLLNSLKLKWQESICKGYIVSNLGFAEPCLFLTLIFLLRAPLQKMEYGILSQKWNGKTVGYVFLYCFPVFILQLCVILIGPQSYNDKNSLRKLPHYFTMTADHRRTPNAASDDVAFCTYPLLSTILLGFFATILTLYLFWLGRRILKLVINKGLQKRVNTLIFAVSSFLPLRVILLGISVLYHPERFLFEALSFSAFLALMACVGLCIFMIVYCPVADSLALNLQDLEGRRLIANDHNETLSLIANQSQVEGSDRISPGRTLDASTRGGSIFFGNHERAAPSTGMHVELSLFSPGPDLTTPGAAAYSS